MYRSSMVGSSSFPNQSQAQLTVADIDLCRGGKLQLGAWMPLTARAAY
jgi:hypothetical protein